MRPIKFHVHGRPQQRGSKRAFANKNGGRPLMVDDNKRSGPWMDSVRNAAAEAMDGRELLGGPLELVVTFYFKRTQGHFGTGRNRDVLKAAAPFWVATKPDADKLMRSVGDALSGTVYRDDSQIVRLVIEKVYTATGEGADICVMPASQEAT